MGNSEHLADLANLVLKKILKRFDRAEELYIRRLFNHVVMSFYNGRVCLILALALT